MTLTFAIALGEVLKSQRHWLKDFHDLTLLRSVHPLSRMGSPAPVPQDLPWFRCHGSGMPPFPGRQFASHPSGVARDQGAMRASCEPTFSYLALGFRVNHALANDDRSAAGARERHHARQKAGI